MSPPTLAGLGMLARSPRRGRQAVQAKNGDRTVGTFGLRSEMENPYKKRKEATVEAWSSGKRGEPIDFDSVCLADHILVHALEKAERMLQNKRGLAQKTQVNTSPSVAGSSAHELYALQLVTPMSSDISSMIDLSEVDDTDPFHQPTQEYKDDSRFGSLTQMVNEDCRGTDPEHRKLQKHLLELRSRLEVFVTGIVDEHRLKQDKLYSMIQDIRRRSLISFELFASMEKIRDLGNRAAHRAETLPERSEVEDIVRIYLELKGAYAINL